MVTKTLLLPSGRGLGPAVGEGRAAYMIPMISGGTGVTLSVPGNAGSRWGDQGW